MSTITLEQVEHLMQQLSPEDQLSVVSSFLGRFKDDVDIMDDVDDILYILTHPSDLEKRVSLEEVEERLRKVKAS